MRKEPLLPEVSFIDRMGYVFLLCAATMFLLGWLKKPADASKAIVIDPALFRTTRLFKGLSILIMVILSTLKELQHVWSLGRLIRFHLILLP